MRSKGILRAQARLKALGFSGVGPADGAFGAATQSALKAYQQATGLSVTGQLDLATQASLSLS
ncbi:MAG: peptidoglycan-binding protein [Myxococcales bacterium]|nr:peptidoglycan-binding protein [Myxococcales bacterium]